MMSRKMRMILMKQMSLKYCLEAIAGAFMGREFSVGFVKFLID